VRRGDEGFVYAGSQNSQVNEVEPRHSETRTKVMLIMANPATRRCAGWRLPSDGAVSPWSNSSSETDPGPSDGRLAATVQARGPRVRPADRES